MTQRKQLRLEFSYSVTPGENQHGPTNTIRIVPRGETADLFPADFSIESTSVAKLPVASALALHAMSLRQSAQESFQGDVSEKVYFTDGQGQEKAVKPAAFLFR